MESPCSSAGGDVSSAVTWLCGAFGFRERLRIADHRVQLDVDGGGAVVARDGGPDAPETQPSSHSVMIRVVNVDQHFERAKRYGAQITSPPTSFPYGERQYSAIDLGGHRWTFTQTEFDSDPASWGGVLASNS